MKTTESAIQKSVLDYLGWISRHMEIYYFRSASGAVNTAQGRYFKTGKPGTPDISLVWHGRYYGLEVKTAKGKQTAKQKQAQAEIEAAGGRYVIVRKSEDVEEIFR